MDIDKLCKSCFYQKDEAEVCPNCGFIEGSKAESLLQLSPGTILADNYIIGHALGQGGFGITYMAWDINLNIRLAIKEYFPQQYATRAGGQTQISPFTGSLGTLYEFGLEKFLQEARILAKFEGHPNIVSVRNYFEINGTAYLVMRYVDGVTLKEYLNNQGGTIPYEKAKALMMPVFDALKEVHGAGILHRDISPDNIFINEKGQVVLLDFGAARQAMSEKGKTLSVILKPGYAPEEQYRSKGVQGAWTDVYSMAATIYRLITGWQPPEALERLVEDPLVPPSQIGADIDDKDEKALLKGLAVRAEDRYQTVEAFQAALLGYDELQETAGTPTEAADITTPPARPPLTEPPAAPQEVPPAAPQEIPPEAPTRLEQEVQAQSAPVMTDEKVKKPFPLKKNHFIAIGAAIAALLIALVGFSVFFGDINDIKLDETSITLEIGDEEFQLNASVKPVLANTDSLVWTVDSAEEGVISIDQHGAIKPLKAGTATVTVSTADKKHQAVCEVEVIKPSITWEGGTYTGELLDGKPHGEGIWSYPDGSSYEGQWVAGLFDGVGKWSGSKGEEYDGDFVQGLFEGKGTFISEDGDRYEGQFSEGLYDGQGKLTLADGTVFEGTFSEGEKHGEGILTLADGTVEEATWEDGVKSEIEEVEVEEEKEIEVAKEATPSDDRAEPPPSTSTSNQIPSISATVVSFKFFETGSPTAHGDYRLYNTRFAVGPSRYICWQIYLTHPAGSQMRSFNLTVTRTFGGSSQVVENRVHHIPAGSTSTNITGPVIGSPTAGTIALGRYQVTLSSPEAGTIAGGSFEIY